jgi:hypothetical protein
MLWVVSRVGDCEGLSRSGSVPGFMSEAMLVCVWVQGLDVRLMTTSRMSTCVPCHRELSAFTRGVYFSMMGWWVSFRLLSVHYSYHSPM